MDFADIFLEPDSFLGNSWKASANGKLRHPTVSAMCNLLTCATKEAVGFYLRENGLDEIAYNRLESLLKVLMAVVEDHNAQFISKISFRSLASVTARKRHAEDEAALRRVSASISGDMTRLAERLLSLVSNEPSTPNTNVFKMDTALKPSPPQPSFVVVRLHGKKPARFQESTTIPTFLEWEKPCVCRVLKSVTGKAGRDQFLSSEKICIQFAKQFIASLRNECGSANVILRTNASAKDPSNDNNTTYMDVLPVEVATRDSFGTSYSSLLSKHFFYRKESGLVEITVANVFPCALSRQSSLLTTEIVATKTQAVASQGK
jgi:hypothetical protein